jgi:serine protease Do
MLQKLFLFGLLMISCAVFSAAQQTGESRIEKRIFVFPSENTSFLGVEAQEISKENFAKFGLSEVRGVAVEKVVENSPAEKGGIKDGDVIVRFNGEQISSVRVLTRLISEVAPDHKVNLTIFRGGSEREISVTMGKREITNFETGILNSEDFPGLPQISPMPRTLPPMPDGQTRGFIRRSGTRRQIGIDVTPLTKQLGNYFGVESGRGLLVDSVLPDSPAAKSGLKAGDVIIEADGREVAGNIDLIRAVNKEKEGSVNLTVIRDKNRQTIIITPETVRDFAAPNFELYREF